MLSIYGNIEYNAAGDTYIAFDEDARYLIYTDYDNASNLYEMTLTAEYGETSDDQEFIGETLRAETYDDVIFVIESFTDKLVLLVTSGQGSRDEVVAAWNEI